EVHRRQIADAIAVVDRHIRAEEWHDAAAEAQRLATIYPDAPQVRVLPAEIEGRRGARKRAMLDEFHAQRNRKDVDGAIATLRRLDAYLTPAEAEGMQDDVRQLFKDKLNNLRTQFTVAVQDKHSRDAIRLGEEIMRDFPNSRLAQEVHDVMGALKQRANEEEPAEAGV
ncbi:MAG TPA: hypothetical protein VK324_04420, partial [Tepidisphaeraceae bacterium]|nr:hypothetical protein [Tepidisphaeraceae bacterium]